MKSPGLDRNAIKKEKILVLEILACIVMRRTETTEWKNKMSFKNRP